MEGFLVAGYYIRVWDAKQGKYLYYWLVEEEKLPEYIFGQKTGHFGSVAAGKESGYTEVEDMEPAKDHIYQCLIGARTACRFYLECPSGISIWGTDERKTATSAYREIADFTMDSSPFMDPSWDTEIFFIENTYPWINAYNPTSIALKPEVRFVGRMFEYKAVVDPDLLEKLEKRIIPSKPVLFGVLRGKGRK